VAILVTRPHPDNATTAAALRAKGFEVLLAPMLRFEPVAFQIDADARFEAVIVSSANALRAINESPARDDLRDRPLFAVGERTAQAARDSGFTHVTAAGGDAVSLRELIVAQARAKRLKKSGELLYLAAADRARDLGTELGELGFNVSTVTVYRMNAVPDLPSDVSAACAAGRIEAVLHYSARSARAFLDAARAAGVEISALALPQCCFSNAVAAIVREAGAAQVAVARAPDEDAIFEVLERALRPRSSQRTEP
jgi:uroporphyrinogen-III synthase